MVSRLTTKVKKWAVAQFLKIPIPSPKQLGYPSHSLAYEMTHSYKNWQPRTLVLPSSSEMAHALSVECVCVCTLSHAFSGVWLSATPWPTAHQALLGMEFSRQEYCSRFLLPPPGDLSHPATGPAPPALAERFFSLCTWEACRVHFS